MRQHAYLGSTLLNARSYLLRLGLGVALLRLDPGVALLRRSPEAALSWGMGHKFASGLCLDVAMRSYLRYIRLVV